MLNKVVLIGRLTKDPELRFTQNQKAVSSFTIAVNRNYTSASGDREADFINVVVWNKTAENVSKYVKKGGLVAVEGRIQTRTYDTPQGERRYVTEVIADNVVFLESKSINESRSNSDFYNDNAQTAKPTSFDVEKDPFADFGNSLDISDDDLPF